MIENPDRDTATGAVGDFLGTEIKALEAMEPERTLVAAPPIPGVLVDDHVVSPSGL